MESARITEIMQLIQSTGAEIKEFKAEVDKNLLSEDTLLHLLNSIQNSESAMEEVIKDFGADFKAQHLKSAQYPLRLAKVLSHVFNQVLHKDYIPPEVLQEAISRLDQFHEDLEHIAHRIDPNQLRKLKRGIKVAEVDKDNLLE